MKAFSNDLRVRVIRAKSAGHSVKDTEKQGSMRLYLYPERRENFARKIRPLNRANTTVKMKADFRQV